MKIITWNVNGLRAVFRKKELQKLIAAQNPDILLLQEIKGAVDQFDKTLQNPIDYHAFYHSAKQPGYSGTAVWVKKNLSVQQLSFHKGFLKNTTDIEGRICRLNFYWKNQPWSIIGTYFPNGGKSPAAWENKLLFYNQFLEDVNALKTQGRACLWGGDVNCAHQPIDLARPKENEGKIGFHPKERDWVSKAIENGWMDVFRKTYPFKSDVYSWWHFITRARERNIGWRIDYFFIDQSLFPQVKQIAYLHDQTGSDHCPLVIEI